MLTGTMSFLKHQKDHIDAEEETQNPTVFPNLSQKIKQ